MDSDSNLIRIEVPVQDGGETHTELIWARRISDGLARIDGFPRRCPRLTVGSLVEIDDQLRLVRVVESTGRNVEGDYWTGRAGESRDRREAVQGYLQEQGLTAVVYASGQVCLCVPDGISTADLRSILSRCPVPIEVTRDPGPMDVD